MSLKIEYAIFVYTRDTSKYLSIAQMTNIHCIRADNKVVLNLLKKDTRFKIKQLPALILIYKNDHTILYDKELKKWFLTVKENIELEAEPQQTPISFINDSPFETQPDPVHTSAPLPPRASATVMQEPLSVTISASPVEASMAASSIKGAHTTEISGEIPVPTKTGIKNEGLSASELAKQMNELREKMDEETDKNKPFF